MYFTCVLLLPYFDIIENLRDLVFLFVSYTYISGLRASIPSPHVFMP